MQKFSIVEDETVIPLLKHNGIQNSAKWYTLPSNYPAYEASWIESCLPFAFDLAFAITNHKAQGQTLQNVILCLSERPPHLNRLINFSAMYVAFSRVKTSSDIRLLVHADRPSELQYLKNLKPDPDVIAFYKGLLLGKKWNSFLALSST